MKYIKPQVFSDSFTCPHCGVLSKQDWDSRAFNFVNYSTPENNQIRTASCHHCNDYSLWIINKMFFPDTGQAPFPNPDMPDVVKK